jgi:hypothetical protein
MRVLESGGVIVLQGEELLRCRRSSRSGLSDHRRWGSRTRRGGIAAALRARSSRSSSSNSSSRGSRLLLGVPIGGHLAFLRRRELLLRCGGGRRSSRRGSLRLRARAALDGRGVLRRLDLRGRPALPAGAHSWSSGCCGGGRPFPALRSVGLCRLFTVAAAIRVGASGGGSGGILRTAPTAASSRSSTTLGRGRGRGRAAEGAQNAEDCGEALLQMLVRYKPTERANETSIGIESDRIEKKPAYLALEGSPEVAAMRS